jgi:ADP-ribose pyrophosphatase YjhB (NUDIX family)
MRRLAEAVLSIRPLSWVLFGVWRRFPFPSGWRSRIIRRVNDRFLVGVIVLIWDDDGRVLLVRNTYDPRYPWTLPGGWMHRGEQPDECARRELREETGFEIALDGLAGVLAQRKLPSVDIAYNGRIASGDFRASAEISRAEFFRLGEFPVGFSPIHRTALAELLRQQSGGVVAWARQRA